MPSWVWGFVPYDLSFVEFVGVVKVGGDLILKPLILCLIRSEDPDCAWKGAHCYGNETPTLLLILCLSSPKPVFSKIQNSYGILLQSCLFFA